MDADTIKARTQSIKRTATGSRSVEYFKAMVFPRSGPLDFSAQLAISSATY